MSMIAKNHHYYHHAIPATGFGNGNYEVLSVS